MTSLQVTTESRQVTIEAVVVRCGCGGPPEANHVCPHPLRTDDLGVIAYWNKNPWKRLMWRLFRRA